MKFLIPFALFLVIQYQILAKSLNKQISCPKATDRDALIWKNLEQVIGKKEPVNSLRNQVVKFIGVFDSESMDRCIGSIQFDQAKSDLKSLFSSSKCVQSLNKMNGNPIMVKLIRKFGEFLSYPNTYYYNLASMMHELKENFYEKFCDWNEKLIQPCLHEELVPGLINILEKHTNGCCKDFFKNVKEGLGSKSFPVFFKEMTNTISQGICSYRIPGLPNSKNRQRCGSIAVKSLMEKDYGHMQDRIIQLFQIPDSEACKAYMGLSYESTTKKIMQFSAGKPLDVCSQFIDTLTREIASTPYIQKLKFGEFAVKDLFTPKKCLPGQKFIDVVPGISYSTRHVLWMKLFNSCLHIPSNFATKCTFIGGISPIKVPSDSENVSENPKIPSNSTIIVEQNNKHSKDKKRNCAPGKKRPMA